MSTYSETPSRTKNTKKTMKRYILIICLAAIAALTATAQDGTGGRWQLHAIFSSSNPTACYDADGRVFYQAGTSLFCYDKISQENESLNSLNRLTDSGVKRIFYQAEEQYIVVAYDNGNIDVILRNDDVVNLPFIKDANITADKTINDITFNNDGFLVATAFGYVAIDHNRWEVKESRIFNRNIVSAAIVGSRILLASEDALYCGNNGKYYGNLDQYTKLLDVSGGITPAAHGSFFYNANELYLATINEVAGGELSCNLEQVAPTTARDVQPTAEGFVASFFPQEYHLTFDADGHNRTEVEGTGIYSMAKAGEWWVLDENGLARIKGEERSASITPNGIDISTTPFWLTYDSHNRRVILSSTTDNAVLTRANHGAKTEIAAYDGDRWTNITPEGVPEATANNGGNHRPRFSPHTPDTYFLATRMNGLCRVVDDKVVTVYNNSNSPLSATYRMPVTAFDSNGNLWVVQSPYQSTPVMALPRSKQTLTTTTPSDWTAMAVDGVATGGFKRAQFTIGAADTKVYTAGDMGNQVVFWQNDPSSLALTKSRAYTSFTDLDGNDYSWSYAYCLTADKNGRVWMGSTNGVVSMDPTEAFGNFYVNRIKVARDDGSGLADYLLSGQNVYCIAVDGLNRKWIGTAGSGLFLVSEDGGTIIKQFTTDNSDLSSNRIYDVLCDPEGNSVFVVTSNSVMEYSSDATPGAPDYKDIYAYPNPVQPNYHGSITIAGLMQNSLVKIADPAGNVVRTIKSTGGMAVWDGRNYNGDEVGSGVYLVMASQNENGSSAAVTKILIIR